MLSTKNLDMSMTEMPSTMESKFVCSEFCTFHTYHKKLQ